VSDLENRIKKLEKQTRANKPESETIVLSGPSGEKTVAKAVVEAIRLGISPEMMGGPEPTEDCKLVCVNSERIKELIERILAGEGTE
jgi:hypothetical protein